MSRETWGDDHGVSERVRGSVLADMLDAPQEFVLRHYQSRRAAAPLCGDGADGYVVDSLSAGITCPGCRAVLDERRAQATERRESRRRR